MEELLQNIQRKREISKVKETVQLCTLNERFFSLWYVQKKNGKGN